MIEPRYFLQIIGGALLFIILILLILGNNFKSDIKTLVYFVLILIATIIIQIVLFYDEKSNVYIDQDTGILIGEDI